MSCNCGCGGCQTKTQGPLLTEGKVKSLLSEGLQYHIDKQIPLFETVYRIGSNKHLALIKEARKLYSRNVIDLCEEDEGLIKTHLGEFGMYKGVAVPLDLPMLYEFRNIEYKGRKYSHEEEDRLDLIANRKFNCKFSECTDEQKDEVLKDKDKVGVKEEKNCGCGQTPCITYGEKQLDEKKKAKKKKKDPPLNKPKRGGSKAYYVYVRDPKTKRIKKVSFGSGGLRAKIRNKKARNAFAKRHRCSEKNDRTKPSYWSCRLPRYASALGLGANMNTFW